ncbi:MAG: UDP-N-acetylmuramate dehydrogenase [Slackia sp.]|nr:UDP-N-acetylmuramate dehydrogenase [Slackia sp.]
MASLLARRLGPEFKGRVLENELMSRHTTYRIGGPARYFIQADDLPSLSRATDALRAWGVPWIALGKGSNLLVSDEGFDGAAIVLGPGFSVCRYNDDSKTFSVGAACRLSHVVREAFSEGRAGFEFAVGTPGTVGGALRMNAGTSREYIGSRVVSVTTLRPGSGLRRYDARDIEWGYRQTSLPYDEVVLECELSTRAGDPEEIRLRMERSLSRRRTTQPLGLPSCGSVFRNPARESVGRLIENVGLKGASCGAAQISELHANFIVNRGGARAIEVLALIHAAQDAVRERYDIELVPEVRFLGFPQ